MSIEPFLEVEDFPVTPVGRLVMSPRRFDPIAVAATELIADQIAIALNSLARDSGAVLDMSAWLVVH